MTQVRGDRCEWLC